MRHPHTFKPFPILYGIFHVGNHGRKARMYCLRLFRWTLSTCVRDWNNAMFVYDVKIYFIQRTKHFN